MDGVGWAATAALAKRRTRRWRGWARIGWGYHGARDVRNAIDRTGQRKPKGGSRVGFIFSGESIVRIASRGNPFGYA